MIDPFTGFWTLNPAESRFTVPAPVDWTQDIEASAEALRPHPARIDGIARKAGAVVFRESMTVSADGNALTTTLVIQRPDGSAVESVAVFNRASEAP